MQSLHSNPRTPTTIYRKLLHILSLIFFLGGVAATIYSFLFLQTPRNNYSAQANQLIQGDENNSEVQPPQAPDNGITIEIPSLQGDEQVPEHSEFITNSEPIPEFNASSKTTTSEPEQTITDPQTPLVNQPPSDKKESVEEPEQTTDDSKPPHEEVEIPVDGENPDGSGGFVPDQDDIKACFERGPLFYWNGTECVNMSDQSDHNNLDN